MNAFLPADILMPKTDHMEKWAVIACDQFTSDQAYWDRVRKNAEGAVSTINLILPEAELGTEKEAEHTAEINATMKKYMDENVFTVYPNSYVYVERTLENGSIREGLVGMVDLDAYDYNTGATSAIRATERTVAERIPPRQRVRRAALPQNAEQPAKKRIRARQPHQQPDGLPAAGKQRALRGVRPPRRRRIKKPRQHQRAENAVHAITPSKV
mgnify:CR=1 FL=1